MISDNLLTQFETEKSLAIAVSGGVDSLTLGVFTHRFFQGFVNIFHAVSPAVPPQATKRLKALAKEENWNLKIIDANEFSDRRYLNNPTNRCFYCKSNLYARISSLTNQQIFSGTNLDDLKEFRPGLHAAKGYRVRHPFVEAKMGKENVRQLARQLGLGEIAELPSSPCLASRVETGIHIQGKLLGLINETELLVGGLIKPKNVRCRVRANGVFIELDNIAMNSLNNIKREEISRKAMDIFSRAGFNYTVKFDYYKVGSAFLHQSL